MEVNVSYNDSTSVSACFKFSVDMDFISNSSTHITNMQEAKTFALLSEEGIEKGIRSITAITTNCAFKKQWNWHTHLSLKLMRHLRWMKACWKRSLSKTFLVIYYIYLFFSFNKK